MPENELLSIKDTCIRYNVSRSQVYKDLGLGKYVAVKDGRRTKIVRASADAHYGSLPPAKIKAPQSVATAVEAAVSAPRDLGAGSGG